MVLFQQILIWLSVFTWRMLVESYLNVLNVLNADRRTAKDRFLVWKNHENRMCVTPRLSPEKNSFNCIAFFPENYATYTALAIRNLCYIFSPRIFPNLANFRFVLTLTQYNLSKIPCIIYVYMLLLHDMRWIP